MGIIKKLDPELIKRIAAGEVVERPSSIVKELVENAIDAGATRIAVDLSNGGLTMIKVADNGIGIAADDIPLLIDRHVTSKIADFDDLENVATLGFRGEAIYSIASVTQFILRSRNRGEDAGTELRYGEGRKDVRTVPHPVGTTVEAGSIFYNTPARRKFLKTSSSEYARCAEVVTRYALAYPQVAFELIHDGRVNLQTTGGGAQDVLLAVFGKAEARAFVPVRFRDQRVGVKGQISDPSLTRTTRKDQTFTINGRVIFDIALNLAFERAYSKLIAEGKHPLCILDINVDPGSIDVNVHPHKREIRLSAPRAVYDAIQRACSEALHREIGYRVEEAEGDELGEATPSPGPGPVISAGYAGDDAVPATSFIGFRKKTKTTVTLEQLADELSAKKSQAFSRQESLPIEDSRPVQTYQPTEVQTFIPPQRSGDIMQVGDTYIVVNREGSVMIADQHNLHETILYREMMDSKEIGVVSQKLLFPITLEFTPEISAVIISRAKFLRRMGYELDDFGGGTFLLRAVPHFVSTDDPKEHVLALFDEMGDFRGSDFEEGFIINAACKAAVKAGTRLSFEEMKKLASHVTGPRGFNCPHGRPAVIILDNEWFSRAFKRPVK